MTPLRPILHKEYGQAMNNHQQVGLVSFVLCFKKEVTMYVVAAVASWTKYWQQQ
jgi:hypothetical protein